MWKILQCTKYGDVKAVLGIISLPVAGFGIRIASTQSRIFEEEEAREW